MDARVALIVVGALCHVGAHALYPPPTRRHASPRAQVGDRSGLVFVGWVLVGIAIFLSLPSC